MKELFQSYAKETSPNPKNEFHMYPLLTMLTRIRELSAIVLITTTQEHEFVTICLWLCEKLEIISKSNNAIDGCFLLLNLCLERHCGAYQQLFQGLFDVIDIGSLADIPFYYLLTSTKYLASDEKFTKACRFWN